MSSHHPDLSKLGEVAERNPLHIWLEPTSRCNTRCAHCNHYFKQFGTDLSQELYAKIREDVLDDVEFVQLCGYGEPLMAPEFSSLLEDCASRGVMMLTSTNGILLRRDEITSRLVRENIILCVSVDGTRKETFEYVRPYIKWEQMLESLECLRRHRELAGSECRARVGFNFVAMKQNIGDLPDMVRLASRYGVEEIYILPLGGEEYLGKMRGQSLAESPELVSKPFRKAMWLAARHRIRLNIPPGFKEMILDGTSVPGIGRRLARSLHGAELLSLRLLRDGVGSVVRRALEPASPRSKAGVSYCLRPWEDAYFSADGTVFPCCIFGQPLGNMNTQNWREIWNGPLYRNLRRTMYSWNPTAICRFCVQPCGIMGGNERQYEHYFSHFQRETLPIDSPEIRWESGAYDLEYGPDGAATHRWLMKHCMLSLPMRRNAKFLRVLTVAQPHRTNPAFCRINGGVSQPFDNTCADLHFPLEDVHEDTMQVVFESEMGYKLPPDTRDFAFAVRGFEYLY